MNIRQILIEYAEKPIGLDTPHPRLSWLVENDRRGARQTAYRIQVATDAAMEHPVWDTGRVASGESNLISYEGAPLTPCTRYHVGVEIWDDAGEHAAAKTTFETAILEPGQWQGRWITPDYDYRAPKNAAPILRHGFQVHGPVTRARVYATAKGLYELRLNGQKVGEDFLTPGWTSYNKRILYQTYDVTSMLLDGENAIGVTIGPGWYQGEVGWRSRRNFYGGRAALLLELHIEYADGTKDVVCSDRTWRSSYMGPVLFSEIYHGETYDATRETPWDQPGFDADQYGYLGVRVMGAVTLDTVHAQEGSSVRIMERLRPIDLFRTPENDLVLDLGQNMTGWMEFTVEGKRGDRVVLSHAEILDPDGNFYTANLKGARQRVEYVLAGGRETFHPHFTFQGFRYVRIEEFPGEPKLEDFTGLVLHTGMPTIGSFHCSSPLIEQLSHNILWGQKGNFVDIPTDCPQRCERLGWTGDIQIFCNTAAMNMNIAMFMTKWLHDLATDQFPSGGVPWVVPDIYEDTYAYDLAGYEGQSEKVAAAWGDAATVCPWSVYQAYGDRRILEQQFRSMCAYVDFIREQGDNPYLWDSGHQLGDWVALDAPYGSFIGATDVDYVATAYYAKSAELTAKTAAVLGDEEKKQYYEDLHGKIVDAFREKYLLPDGTLRVKTQTALILAIHFRLVPDALCKQFSDQLAQWLEDTNYDLITGFVGTPYICFALSDFGNTEAAYRLLQKKEYPSWLYQVTKGATTVWEHLDGLKPDGTLWNPRMNSFNHYAYGAVGEWLYKGVTGVNHPEDAPGYRRIVLDPQIGGDLTSASFSLETPYGRLHSGWSTEEASVVYDVTVPFNTEAALRIRGFAPDAVWEGGKPAASGNGIEAIEASGRDTILHLGAGTYRFICNK